MCGKWIFILRAEGEQEETEQKDGGGEEDVYEGAAGAKAPRQEEAWCGCVLGPGGCWGTEGTGLWQGQSGSRETG